MEGYVHPENILRFSPESQEVLRPLMEELRFLQERGEMLKKQVDDIMLKSNEIFSILIERKMQISQELLKITEKEHPEAVTPECKEFPPWFVISEDSEGIYIVNLKDVFNVSADADDEEND
jgi:hypothetical protein